MITGANRGIGLELVRQYVDAGYQVIAACRRNSPELELLVERKSLTVHRLDLTSDDAIENLGQILSDIDVHLLLHVAGTMGRSTFGESGFGMQAFGHFDRAEWHDVFDINVCTPQKLTEVIAPKMPTGGKIAVFTSMLGSHGLNTQGGLYAYRASKAAVNMIVTSMSIDLAGAGLIVVAIHPGWVRTEMGGLNADIDVATSANGIRAVLGGLTPADSGKVLAYDGSELPY